MFKRIFITALIVAPVLAMAQNVESLKKASELGPILASEKHCNLSYDQAAISQWVDDNTDPADMGFAGLLESITTGAEYNLEGQSESAKTAHCRAVERAARHHGFIQ